jgi:hypothetical protein
VAWEWIELMPGVLIISDVNGLVSNARFMTEDGRQEDELRAIATSNLIAYSTPWQNEVMSHLHPNSAPIQPRLVTTDELSPIVPQRVSGATPLKHGGYVRKTQMRGALAARR